MFLIRFESGKSAASERLHEKICVWRKPLRFGEDMCFSLTAKVNASPQRSENKKDSEGKIFLIS